MGYKCHDFCNGQILDAKALNEMEQGIQNSVRHTKQTLTPEQQAQARNNIGAVSSVNGVSPDEYGNVELDISADCVSFYKDLASAVDDINEGGTGKNTTDIESAAVKVFTADSGRTTVRLLKDVSVVGEINVEKDIDLVLNGKTITLTTAAAYLRFAEGTNCSIDGKAQGSAIQHENAVLTQKYNMLDVYGDSMKITGGTYKLSGSFELSCFAIMAEPGSCKFIELDGCDVSVVNTSATTVKQTVAVCLTSAEECVMKHSIVSAKAIGIARASNVAADKGLIEHSVLEARSNTSAFGLYNTSTNCIVDNCNIKAVASDDNGGDENYGHSYGIYNQHTLTIKNSIVFADAQGDDAYNDYAIGINNRSDPLLPKPSLICIDTDVTGTHSGIQSAANLFVKGGTYSSHSHGGFYLIHEPEDFCYINDATIRYGVYEGEFTNIFPSEEVGVGGGFYFGLGHGNTSNGISLYMDGCKIIEGESLNHASPFIVRPAAPGFVNVMYVSNTSYLAGTGQTIRLSLEETGGSAELKIGVGCSFGPNDTTDPNKAEETGKLYRRLLDSIPMDGRDFSALANFANSLNNT